MYFNNEYNNLHDHHLQISKYDFNKIILNRDKSDNYILEDKYIYLDFSRNLIDSQTLPLLEKFLISKNFIKFRENIFSGQIVNATENKSADHIALRNSENTIFSGKVNLINDIKKTLNKIQELTNIVHNKTETESLAGNIKHIVHIGIGGSDLGPRLVVDALQEFKISSAPEVLFISSVDPYELNRILNKVDLKTTLFILVSKSFKTPEILSIANFFITTLKKQNINFKKHFLLVSANPEAYKIIDTFSENVLNFPDTIGGRFSLWSAVGLSISISIGFENFKELLNGASEMDHHFLNNPPLNNMPVILALLEFWYTNFYNSQFYNVSPYTERLKLLPMFLEQLQMESNGKTLDLYGNQITYSTTSAVFGTTGTNCQHSYFQALHQGSHFFHCDLIGLLRAPDYEQNKSNYTFLFASILAQAQTMIFGYKSNEKEIVDKHKSIDGNKPCNLIFIKKWSPASLGNLLAMYEHKTVALGALWQINSFDQWGVERGKKSCSQIETCIKNDDICSSLIDPLSEKCIRLYKYLK
ncbi:MAG: glucose-6-phosphate isomerase [Spirochaetia bacterium]|nr:glucose-6-phosphate isomerase [Spirochaetia bacterium]